MGDAPPRSAEEVRRWVRVRSPQPFDDADVVPRPGKVPGDRTADRPGADDDRSQRRPRPAGAAPRSAVRGVTPASRSSVFLTFAVGVFGSSSTSST